MKTSHLITSGAVGVAVLIAALILGPRPVSVSDEHIGDPELAALLAENAPAGSQNLSAFQIRDGDATFAGLGAGAGTEFEIGSVTKIFTAQLLHQAIEAGELTPDTTVSEIIDTGASPISEVTLLELAEHTSGLPRLAGVNLWDNAKYLAFGTSPYEGITAEDILNLARDASLASRGKYEYSNFGVSLLGHLLAQNAGTTYEELLRSTLLEPLGMGDTTLHAGEESPLGFNSRGRTMAAWDDEGYAPAGGLRSTAADMEIFAQYLLDQGIPEFTWVHDDPNTIWHNGGTGGFSSMLLLDPENNSAAYVVTSTTARVDDLGRALLEELR
ncbi:D-alanyl-D-alanine-carboxypeptidase/endopeptidase AmpH precursor [Corynebacterium occultum]|uniref:D-alanyl-D-alanine-carboxypeptidase/endopeptidase AmpH n=1 Tax=Corynebacterium occultum TaxID=2675219 RepID=A0A6B8W8B4_9CORY|nr:serine hydrolase domain-containing protein [Corynebacterium occultum]QGU07126.1 D-alanyl-D-alanine-carboxypeptidase/endopeptidase AmpH precursor [Corynebacterium occultum]